MEAKNGWIDNGVEDISTGEYSQATADLIGYGQLLFNAKSSGVTPWREVIGGF